LFSPPSPKQEKKGASEFHPGPGVGRQTGNFAQALTHIALINTSHNLGDARKSERPAMQRSA
jgi:hypothetical protein